jgi:uncharacterized membrane protein YraQ (UPF0718 family)
MSTITEFLVRYIVACWDTLVAMAPYISLGFLVAGLLHIFVNTQTIIKYLGKGRITSVIYAALLGIPLPLCSCAVLPTTTSLKKQGANNGAAMSFLISTPETGVDSIAVTYALLDPIMTIFRPLAAFVTAVLAGLTENFFGNSYATSVKAEVAPDLSCKVDNCCGGIGCPSDDHRKHHSLTEKLVAGLKYGFGEILNEIAGWLLLGLAIAGVIQVLVPEQLVQNYLQGGMISMLIMLVIGIPFYICATGSTPIAAALILKGVSPGAALVFLLAGPATNAATISVVYGLFKKRATAIYLGSIAVCAVIMGLLLDQVYARFNISATVVAGQAAEFIPHWFSILTALFLLFLMLNSLVTTWRRRFTAQPDACCDHGCSHSHS